MDELRIDIVNRPAELLSWLSRNGRQVEITQETSTALAQKVPLIQIEKLRNHFEEIDRNLPGTPGRLGFTVKFKNLEDYAYVKMRYCLD